MYADCTMNNAILLSSKQCDEKKSIAVLNEWIFPAVLKAGKEVFATCSAVILVELER
jgi:hypothetical protein